MRIFILILFVLSIFISKNSYSQYGNFYLDNGSIRGYYGDIANFEETVILKPPVPGIANKVFIYLSGTNAARDTIWFVGDPTDGSLPPSLWCHYINTYHSVIFDYPGKPGWYEFSIENASSLAAYKGIRVGGLNALVVQHVIKQGGPYFTVDKQNQSANNANSFLNNVYKPNPDFYNITGTIISITQGRYMVRLQMDYEFKDENNKPLDNPPSPTLIDVTSQVGIVNNTEQPIAFEMASFTDWNNDGYDDISISGNYLKNNGDGTFENVSDKVNIQNYGSVWADVDNDGYMDFYAARGGTGDRIYFGKSDGTYEESTKNTFAIDAPTVSPLFLDYDGDGLLDLFVANGRRESGGVETYYQDKIYKNLGNREFKDVTVETGIAAFEKAPFYDTWGATVCDYNADGKPDIFVATYRLAPDLLYKNNGDGTFTEVGGSTKVKGAPTYVENYFGHGMGADWGMMNDDVYPDLIVGNLSHPDGRALNSNPSLVWQNNAQNIFSDVTRKALLGFYEMNSGVVIADLNNDEKNDVIHAQYAYYKKGQGLDKNTRVYLQQSGQDETAYSLKDITWESGLRIHGAWTPVRGDFNNDGGMDLLIASSNENVKLFENNLIRGNWISFKLKGDGNNVNRDAYGSSINIINKNGKKRTAQLPGTMLNGRAAQSSNDLHFGLDNDEYVEDAEVIFSDGVKRNLGKLRVNVKYLVDYDGNVKALTPMKPILYEPLNMKKYKVKDNIDFKFLLPENVVKYEFQVFDSKNRNVKNIIAETDLENIELQMNFTNLGIFSWQVKSTDSNGEELISDRWYFEIYVVSKIQLLNPANNSINVHKDIVLSWQVQPEMKAVHLEISKNSDFSGEKYEIKSQQEIMISSYSCEEFPLENNTKYYWRVRAAEFMDENKNAEWIEWSDVFNFTTEAGTTVNNGISEAKFAFTSISPNPVAGELVAAFELPYFANLSMTIYDSKGSFVEEIMTGYFEPGIHNIKFDVNKYFSGTYFLRITDGVKIISEKLIITR
jgi:hypothetical protein